MKSLQTMRILWGAMSMTPILFWMVMVTARVANAGNPEPVLLVAFASVSVSIAVTSFFLPRYVYAQGAKGQTPALTSEPDPKGEAAFRDMVPSRRVFSDREAALRLAGVLHQTPLILSLALSEMIAMFGLVLGMQFQFEHVVVAPFFVVSFVLLLARFPVESRIVGQLENAFGAKII